MGEVREQGDSVKDVMATTAATLAVLGVISYAGMSITAAWVYEPTGVSLSNLGVTSGAILGQAAGGVAAFLIMVCILVIGGFIVISLVSTARSREFKDPGALLKQVSPDPKEVSAWETTWLQGHMLTTAARVALWFGSFFAVVLAVAAFGVVAWNSRDSIAAGKSPGFILGLPLPWNAQIAGVRPLPNSRDVYGLPRCALYLGQADGTVLLRDGPNQRTIRVPASAIRLDLTGRHEC